MNLNTICKELFKTLKKAVGEYEPENKKDEEFVEILRYLLDMDPWGEEWLLSSEEFIEEEYINKDKKLKFEDLATIDDL